MPSRDRALLTICVADANLPVPHATITTIINAIYPCKWRRRVCVYVRLELMYISFNPERGAEWRMGASLCILFAKSCQQQPNKDGKRAHTSVRVVGCFRHLNNDALPLEDLSWVVLKDGGNFRCHTPRPLETSLMSHELTGSIGLACFISHTGYMEPSVHGKRSTIFHTQTRNLQQLIGKAPSCLGWSSSSRPLDRPPHREPDRLSLGIDTRQCRCAD